MNKLLEKYYKTEDENPELTLSEDIVFSILGEMDDRKGLSGFEECDLDTQSEILETLVDIVNKKINK